MINEIEFENYKSFKSLQKLELKPLTIIIGKNSSGKSSVVKLPSLIETSLKGISDSPVLLKHDNIEHGAEFRDLVYGRIATSTKGTFSLGVKSSNEHLKLKIGPMDYNENKSVLYSWILNNKEHINEKITFKGFITEKYPLEKIKIKTDYIGPFRKLPQRGHQYEPNLNPNKFGYFGEWSYNLLLDSFFNNEELFKLVSNWYREKFDGWELNINSKTKPFYQIELSNGVSSINIKDVGQGMSQVLPLIIRANKKAIEETLIIIEQPELHLHPGAHGDIAQLFTESYIKDKNKRYLIETHSQNFILRIRRLIAQKKIDKDSVALYYVNSQNEESSLDKIEINDKGEVSEWPSGIFSETLDEVIALRDAQKG